MAEFEFGEPGNIVRGRLVNYRTGAAFEFAYNPNNVSEPHVANLSTDDTPGQSDGIVRFASGKTREIRFTLKLSGERRLRMFGASVINDADPIEIPENSYSIRGELAFLESFTFPTDPEDGGDGAPDLVVFTFGPRWPGVLCVVQKVEAKNLEYAPDLDPTDADVEIVLMRKVDKNRFSNTIWRGAL